MLEVRRTEAPIGRRSVIDAIETEGLTKSYGAARGIVDLDLTVPTTTVFGFLGPNGAGKTTTIRLLLDFLRPTRGRATVLGLDSRRDAVAIKQRVGYVPGDPAFYERLTAAQLFDWLGRLRGGVDPQLLAHLTERFDVDVHRPIRTLSKGNRQKIAVVQAFMHRPELLVLDEPTSGLDPLLQHEFDELVHEVTADGATVFLSSHLLDEVQHLCDRVAIVRDGRLVTVEDVATLRARAVREVTIRFEEPVDPTPFSRLPGVTDVEVVGSALHCHLAGTADALVKLAARHAVVDFTSAPPDLEAMFLQFYETKEADGGTARR
jgi:ABC-2 type transport system ATP-binding protein